MPIHHHLCTVAILCALFTTPISTAATPTLNQVIDPLTISEHGELILVNDKPAFQPWSTDRLTDGTRMHVLMYIAATLGADRANKPFTDALNNKGFGFDQVMPTSIINVSQAPWGSAGIVMHELTRNKRKYPQATLVADTLGLGLTVWALKPSSYAVMILDPYGKILFFKDGALAGEEIEQALQILSHGVSNLPIQQAPKP